MPEIVASASAGRTPDRRKLVAVVYADMVGYSRLIGLDDAGTLARLRQLRGDLIDPAIDEHGGRIVQTGGDFLLIAFDSIDGAVRCAVKVQQQVPILDGDHPPDQAIRFRIGINLGDTIADGTDLHGDAVNVAARLQAECPPGGICVTRGVRDHVRDRLDLAFDDLGALELKNISRPVEAFLLRAVGTSAGSVRSPSPDGRSHNLPRPGKPSIAVLAFTNMSGDLEQEYFSDGIAADIITELSRNRSLFVIARNSSFTYKGRAVDVKHIARELGVRYVVEGSVRRGGNRIRVSAQLIDADSGSHIWGERFNRDLADIFEVQDEITGAITTAINPAISHAERQRAMQKPPENLGAWEAYQQALWHWSKQGSARLSPRARFPAAGGGTWIRGSRNHMPCWPWLYLSEATLGVGLSLREGLKLAEAAARTAVALDPDNSMGHAMLAWAHDHQGEMAYAQEEADIAVGLNPNDPFAQMTKGRVLVFSGQAAAAQEPLTIALRLDPSGPTAPAALHHLGLGYYFAQDYVSAEATTRRAIRAFPDFPRTLPGAGGGTWPTRAQ